MGSFGQSSHQAGLWLGHCGENWVQATCPSWLQLGVYAGWMALIFCIGSVVLRVCTQSSFELTAVWGGQGWGCSRVPMVGCLHSFGFAAAWGGWGSECLPVSVAVQSLGGLRAALNLPGHIVG